MVDSKSVKKFADEFIATLDGAKKVVCIIDSRLDFDAVCSGILIRNFVKKTFLVDCEMVFLKEISDSFKTPLKKINSDVMFIKENIDAATIDYMSTDVVIVVDCGSQYKLSSSEGFSFPTNRLTKIINIDHHFGVNSSYGDLNFLSQASSTCSMLFSLFEALDYRLDDVSIKYLLLGILSDSGYLTYDKSDYSDVEMVASLLKKSGLRIYDISEISKVSMSLDELKVKGIILKNLQVFEKKIAYSYFESDELESARIDPKINLSFSTIDEIKNIEGVKITFFIRYDQKQSAYTLSMRSYDESYDVNEICKANFNGGGHKLSAGGIIREQLPIKMVINSVLAVLKTYCDTK